MLSFILCVLHFISMLGFVRISSGAVTVNEISMWEKNNQYILYSCQIVEALGLTVAYKVGTAELLVFPFQLAQCKTALLTHWRYCSLALSHRFDENVVGSNSNSMLQIHVQTCAHATAAVLSWHVQNFVMIWWPKTELKWSLTCVEYELGVKQH